MTGKLSFLSTDEEYSAWHLGLWKGIRIHNPWRLRKETLAINEPFRFWEDDEGQYHDTAMYLAYILKMVAYVLFAYLGGTQL